jgi:hypothetical protein
MSQHPPDSGGAVITLRLASEDAEALLSAVDGLQPLLERVRAQIAPAPAPQPATAVPASPVNDALTRATRLARQSLQEARRLAVGERTITPEQRKAWQDAARRYWVATRRSIGEAGRRGLM